MLQLSIPMDYKALLVTLLELNTAYRIYCCVVQREDYCTCDARRKLVSCSRLQDSVDTILPGLIPVVTKELVMKRVWVDDAVELNPRNFATLRNLLLIDFSYNRISEIRPGTFSDMKRLIWVNLSHNRLKLLDPEAFTGHFPKLQTLDLSRNKILLIIDDNLKSMKELRFLDLRDNPVLFLSGQAFRGLPRLERLHLSSANFTEFPVEPLRPLLNLKVLELRYMPLLNFIPPHAFSSNNQLQALVLENIPLASGVLPADVFVGLHNLRNLTVTSCNLTAVPCGTMTHLRRLEFLDLSGNPLKVIYPMDFAGVESLKKLSLQRTALEEIKNGSFAHLHNLQSLDLSNNRLKTLYEESFPDKLFGIEDIVMTNNAWSCDCSLKWLANSTIYLGMEPVTCADPHQARGRSLIQLRPSPLPDTFYECLPPKATGDTASITGKEGTVVTLPCRASGAPPLMFTWFKAATGLMLRDQASDEKHGNFRIGAVQREDAGVYICLVRNSGGKAYAKVRLHVKESEDRKNDIGRTSHENKNDDCSSDTASIQSASSKGPSRESPASDLTKGSGVNTAVLIGILAFVTGLGIFGIFVLVGCIWSKRRKGEIATTKATTATNVQTNGNGTCHHGRKSHGRVEGRHQPKVFGDQGVHYQPPKELNTPHSMSRQSTFQDNRH